MNKKIIFTTTDIFEICDEEAIEKRGLRNGHPDVVTWIEDHDKPGAKAAVVTTHLLERALEQGFEVFVFSTRRRFREHDTWWRKQVDTKNVICSGDYAKQDDAGLHIATMRAVHILAARMGVKWPTYSYEDRDGEKVSVPQHWVAGIAEMAKEHGFLLANDLRR